MAFLEQFCTHKVCTWDIQGSPEPARHDYFRLLLEYEVRTCWTVSCSLQIFVTFVSTPNLLHMSLTSPQQSGVHICWQLQAGRSWVQDVIGLYPVHLWNPWSLSSEQLLQQVGFWQPIRRALAFILDFLALFKVFRKADLSFESQNFDDWCSQCSVEKRDWDPDLRFHKWKHIIESEIGIPQKQPCL